MRALRGLRLLIVSNERPGIVTVGRFQMTPDGWEPVGFQFVFAGELPETVLKYDFEAKQIAGWTLAALHEVAHGTPCVVGADCTLPER